MEKTMPRDLYEQEVLGLFTSAAGLVCREFDITTGTWDTDYPLVDLNGNSWYLRELLEEGNVNFHSIDSGYSHYFGSLHFVDVPYLDHIICHYEYTQNKTVTSVHADNIKDFEHEAAIDVAIRYADPGAAQQVADFAEHNLYFNKSEKSLRETIITLNTLFYQKSAVTGRPKLLITTNCSELIRQVTTVQWKEGLHDFQTKEQNTAGTKPFKPDSDRKTDWDLFDALRYGIYSYVKSGAIGISVIETENDEFEELDPQTLEMIEHGFIRTQIF